MLVVEAYFIFIDALRGASEESLLLPEPYVLCFPI